MKRDLLLADDDDLLRASLTDMLCDDGYDVTQASDGNEAIEVVNRHRFDIAILDVRMPGASGIDVLEHIKERSRATKVVMLTAYADLATAMKVRRLGADEFIGKPYDYEELRIVLDRLFPG